MTIGSRFWKTISVLALAVVSGCGGGSGGGGGITPLPTPTPPTQSKITHVVIIFQENRTVDNLFNGLPGADTVTSGQNSAGQTVPLQPISLTAPYDLDHSHRGFVAEYNGGSMNGFDKVGTSACSTGCPPPSVRAYGYVPQSEAQPYFPLAERFAFADRM